MAIGIPLNLECNNPCIINKVLANVSMKRPLGDTVEMQCDIHGTLKQSQLVIWEKDGETLFMNKVAFHRNIRLMLRQTELSNSRVSSILLFRNLQMSDKGVYICKISDSEEELTFSLSVFEPNPEVFYSKLKKVEIKAPGYIIEKQPFNISCMVDTTSSQARLFTVDWYRNGVYQSTSNSLGRVLIKQIISLSMSNVYSEHSASKNDDIIRNSAILLFQYPTSAINGIYECRAYKPISQMQHFHIDSAAVKIKVHSINQDFRTRSSESDSSISMEFPTLQSNTLSKQQNNLLQNDGLGKKDIHILVTSSTASHLYDVKIGWAIRAIFALLLKYVY